MLKYRFQVCTKSEGAHFNTVVWGGGGGGKRGDSTYYRQAS